MPIFEYKALRENGKPATGVIDADTAREARIKLRDRHIHVTDIQEMDAVKGGRAAKNSEAGGKGQQRLTDRLANLRRGASVADMALVTRQFATLLRAGIPLSDSLTALIDQIEQKDLQTVFRDIREKINQGSTLHEAMASHPRYFGTLFSNMIKAGEASGTLDEILMRLAEYQQTQARTRGKVQAALAYPIIMVVVGVGVVVFLLTSVLPKMTTLLVRRGGTLPLPTRMLMGLSDFLKTWWFPLVLAIVGMVTAFRLFVSTDKGRLWFDTYKLRMPIFGPLLRKQAIARFSMTLSTLLRSGVPAMEALGIVKTVTDNKLLSNTLEDVRARILEGADIATPMKRSKVFPPVVGYMIAVGEQSGQLEDMLEKVAETYSEEIELATQKLTSVLEPLIIVVLSVAVVTIILAVLLPMMNITTMR